MQMRANNQQGDNMVLDGVPGSFWDDAFVATAGRPTHPWCTVSKLIWSFNYNHKFTT